MCGRLLQRQDGWQATSESCSPILARVIRGRIVEAVGDLGMRSDEWLWGMGTCDVYSSGSSGRHLEQPSDGGLIRSKAG